MHLELNCNDRYYHKNKTTYLEIIRCKIYSFLCQETFKLGYSLVRFLFDQKIMSCIERKIIIIILWNCQ